VLPRSVGPVAGVRGAWVAMAGACRPRRGLAVGGAACALPAAALRRIALPGRRAALGKRRQEAVRRTRGARARARLDRIACSGGRAADRARVPRRMLACVAAPVARVRRARVTVVGARRAARLLGIRRASGTTAGAIVREVAFARRTAAHDA